ncbi:MAG: PDGLE domain-containing protein [bacterium]
MKKLFWVSIVIAILASFFASTHPDGLDFISEKLGFAEKGVEGQAIMAGYGLKYLPEGGLSTSMAGIAGILIILGIFWLTAYTLKKGEKMKRQSLFVGLLVCLLVSMSSSIFAATPYLYANTTWGAMGGGLGFDLGEGRAVDFCATAGSGASGSTYQLYADYFIGNWGVGATAKKMTVNSDLAFDLNLQYALEQEVNDKVTVGAAFTLINYDTTAGADPNWTLLPSIGAYIKLPL